jgi:hypothetical protein
MKKTTLIAVAATALLLAVGCSQKYSAERDGKKIGQAICDLRNATTAEDAADARSDALKQLDDLGSKYAMYTAEDRRDIENNLADLAEHSIQGNSVLTQQDVAVLQRSTKHIAEDANETAEAAWEGVNEGIGTCIG